MSKTKRIEDLLVQHREEWVNALKEHEEQALSFNERQKRMNEMIERWRNETQ